VLGTATLEPRGMAPCATLIVRRLRDPLRKRLMADANSIVASRDWDQAVQDSLTGMYRGAAQPAHGPVPRNAAAVLFADQAELLACLSRDLIAGIGSSLWWWRAILRALPCNGTAPLFAAWQRDAAYIPAALAILASRGAAAGVVSVFTPEQAWSLVESVVRVFDLDALREALASPLDAWAAPAARSDSGAPAEPALMTDNATEFPRGGKVEGALFEARALPPWLPISPKSDLLPSFGVERAALLGISLALQASPPFVRSRRFARDFSAWRWGARVASFRPAPEPVSLRRDSPARQPEESTLRPDPGERNVESADTVAEAPSRPEPRAASPEDRAGPESAVEDLPRLSASTTEALPSVSSSNRDSTIPPPEAVARAEIAEPAAPGVPPADAACLPHPAPSQASAAPPAQAGAATARLEPEPSAQPLLSPAGDAWFGDPLPTEIGGVLFLVSAMKALRLPASLEEACGCELGIGSWELLELIARCLLGPRSLQFQHDPIWKALALLDGRALEVPAGRNLAAAAGYRLPQAWIDAPTDPAGDRGIRLRGTRLEVWHPLGFLLSDCDGGSPPARPGSPLCPASRHARRWSGCAPLDLSPSPPLRRFLAFLMPYVRWHLARGLGLATASRRTLAAAVLIRPASLWRTSSHVDLVMHLSQATSRIRMSGLDADPGWMPDFGRVVKFHYRASNAL
jgi:hypothetical protein